MYPVAPRETFFSNVFSDVCVRKIKCFCKQHTVLFYGQQFQLAESVLCDEHSDLAPNLSFLSTQQNLYEQKELTNN